MQIAFPPLRMVRMLAKAVLPVLGMLALFPERSQGLDTLQDPRIEGKVCYQYEVRKKKRKPSSLILCQSVLAVENQQVYLLHMAEEYGIETEVMLSRESLRPFRVKRTDQKELVYQIEYAADCAQVFVPIEAARKSQDVIPPFLQRRPIPRQTGRGWVRGSRGFAPD